jgi:hypothetical protein
MRRPNNLCLMLAGTSLVGGLLTMQVGQAQEVAAGQLVLAGGEACMSSVLLVEDDPLISELLDELLAPEPGGPCDGGLGAPS